MLNIYVGSKLYTVWCTYEELKSFEVIEGFYKVPSYLIDGYKDMGGDLSHVLLSPNLISSIEVYSTALLQKESPEFYTVTILDGHRELARFESFKDAMNYILIKFLYKKPNALVRVVGVNEEERLNCLNKSKGVYEFKDIAVQN